MHRKLFSCIDAGHFQIINNTNTRYFIGKVIAHFNYIRPHLYYFIIIKNKQWKKSLLTALFQWQKSLWTESNPSKWLFPLENSWIFYQYFLFLTVQNLPSPCISIKGRINRYNGGWILVPPGEKRGWPHDATNHWYTYLYELHTTMHVSGSLE